ncbi:MAG: transposase [Actinobacteria bacterium]|nr:transposase [Actinomycetota bacterium]
MRPPRIQVAGSAYHLTSRGNRKQEIVRDDTDRVRLLTIVRDVVLRRKWICLAYCLMTNHYHLLVITPNPDLATGMHALNSGVARTFNKRHGYTGHLLERRYSSELILTDAHLLDTVRYIALNPVRAGLCEFPDQWPWSSYRASIGLAPAPDFLAVDELLALFSHRPETAQRALEAFVMGRVAMSRAA